MAIDKLFSAAAGGSPAGIIASAIPGIAKGIGSLFGGRKRRREERRAQGARDRAMRSFEQLEFTNPYADMTNPYADIENRMEDLRVGTQAAEFTTEQQQQQLANVLEQFRDVGGGTGGAAVATALARQSSRNVQMAAANIEQQELKNEQMAAQAGMQLDLQGAKGEQTRQLYTSKGESERQQLEMGKRSQVLGLANQELAGAKAARAQAKSDLIGGIGSAATAAFGAGVFGKKSGTDWGAKFKELDPDFLSNWKSGVAEDKKAFWKNLGTFQGYTLPIGNANQSQSLSNINPLTGLPYGLF